MMHEQQSHDIAPIPTTGDEAAAIAVAIHTYLVVQRTNTAHHDTSQPERRWALAGRLAGQGQCFTRVYGARLSWGSADRLASYNRDGG